MNMNTCCVCGRKEVHCFDEIQQRLWLNSENMILTSPDNFEGDAENEKEMRDVCSEG